MTIINKSIFVYTVIPVIGILIIISWMLLITPTLKNDFAAFEDIREYIGKDSYVEHIGDDLPVPIISRDFLTYEIINSDKGILEIKSHYLTTGITDGEKIYENINTYFVDSATRKHVDNEEWYFIFPTDVQKQDYLLLDPNMEVPSTFVFEETKYIGDLEVYIFSCETIGDDFSDAWQEFAPVIVYADQTCRTSIEPITGKTVEFLITWDMYVMQDGQHISIELGGAETTDFTELILLESAKNTKQLFYFYDFLIPVFIILIFIGIFSAGLYNHKSIQKEKIISEQFKKLQQANKLKIDLLEQQKKQEKLSIIGELSARLAHDLRNPLSVIVTSLENLQEKYGKISGTEASFSRTGRAIDRIVHQIEDILEFVQSRKLEKENFSSDEIISEVISSLHIPEGITIKRPEQNLPLYCDYVKMCTLLKNLIYNGIQACKDEGIIEIKIQEDLDSILLYVVDSGPGIPEEILNKIFDPLFTTKQHGTGLGLASCKTIVDSHGGSIQAFNNPTSFMIILPKSTKE